MNFKELVVWQRAMELAQELYFLTRALPKEEMYALSSQMRRAAISIPSNIAEGNCRTTKKDYVQFLHIAHGSLAELETQLLLTARLYPRLSTTNALALLTEVSKMLTTIIKKLSD